MTEMLAENRFCLTKALFTEGMLRVWRERAGSSGRKLLAVLALAWIVLTIFTLTQGGSPVFPAVELMVLALVALWVTVWLPRQRARRAYSELEKRGTAESRRTTRFYADRLEISTEGYLTAIDYADIRYTLQSDHLLILIAEDKTGVMVKRDSFTHGTEEDVLRTIENVKKESAHHD